MVGCAEKILFSDIVQVELARIELLWQAFRKIRYEQRDKPLADIAKLAFKDNCLGDGGYLKHIKLTITENEMEIFPSRLLASHTLGSLSAFVEIYNK